MHQLAEKSTSPLFLKARTTSGIFKEPDTKSLRKTNVEVEESTKAQKKLICSRIKIKRDACQVLDQATYS